MTFAVLLSFLLSRDFSSFDIIYDHLSITDIIVFDTFFFPSLDKILVHLKLQTCFVVPRLFSAIRSFKRQNRSAIQDEQVFYQNYKKCIKTPEQEVVYFGKIVPYNN